MLMLVEVIVALGAALLWWRFWSFDHVHVCYSNADESENLLLLLNNNHNHNNHHHHHDNSPIIHNLLINNNNNNLLDISNPIVVSNSSSSSSSSSNISSSSISSSSSSSSSVRNRHHDNVVKRLVHRLEILRKPYYFPVWSFNGNIHSFYGNWVRWGPQQQFFREDLIAADGQIISLDWTVDDLPKDAPLVFLLPGINGGSSNEYAKYFVEYFRNEGWRVAVYNRPGARGTKLISSRIIQFPDSDYVSMLFNHIMQKYPRAPLLALGISLGGNSLLRYLGQKGDQLQGRILGAISLSNPFDFLGTMKRIRQIKFYDNWLCRKAVSLIKDHSEVMKRDESLDVEEIFKVTSTEDFDKAYTMKILAISDYQELEEMYRRNSCLNFLHNIRVPTLIANALDDPLVGDSFVPEVTQQVMANRNLVLATTKHGGHGCWFEGFVVPSGKTWMDRLSVEFIQAVLELRANTTPR